MGNGRVMMVVRTYCHLWNKNKDIEQPLTRWVQSQNSDIYCIVIIIVVILLLYVLYYVNNYFNSITWSSTNLEKTYFEKTLGKTCFLLKNPVFIVFFLNSIFLANPANHHMDKDALCNKKAKHATQSHSSKLNTLMTTITIGQLSISKERNSKSLLQTRIAAVKRN